MAPNTTREVSVQTVQDHVGGKNNNLNLIRMIAALAVVFSHSFAISSGTPTAEPGRESLGMTLGDIAVDIFFITSGFLVTKSLLSRADIIDFVWGRALRVVPGLLVMLVLTVLGLGAWLTRAPLQDYLSDPQTWFYLFKNTGLIAGAEFDLPGLFEGNPLQAIVNGSLWTLPFEVGMYGALALLWLAVLWLRLDSRHFQRAILLFAVGAALFKLFAHYFFASESHLLRLFQMFFLGGAFYVLRAYIPLSRTLFAAAVALLAVATPDRDSFFLVYNLVLGYVLLYLAFVPAGRIRAFNEVGDYSYGLYIYSFPVQQTLAAVIPGIEAWTMVILSIGITLPLAVVSWYLVERHALGYRQVCATGTKAVWKRLAPRARVG